MTTIPKGVALEFELRDLRRVLDASRELVALLIEHRREVDEFRRENPIPHNDHEHDAIVDRYVRIKERQVRETTRAGCLLSMAINTYDATQTAIASAMKDGKLS